MILGDTLRTVFSTAKPLTNENKNSDVLPVLTVYRNGVLFAPPLPPVAAVVALGEYSLTYALTAANGHAANDWITIAAQLSFDGAVLTVPVWQGNLVYEGADVSLVLGQTIYPMFTTHRPSDGTNANEDPGLPPGGGLAAIFFRNLAPIGGVVLVTAATGVHIATLALTVVNGWALGNKLDISARTTIDNISRTSWVFSGGGIVAAGGGGGAGSSNIPHYEVIGQPLKME